MDYKNWLIEQIASEVSISKDQIDCDEIFENFQLDSLSIVSIAFEMEDVFHLKNIEPSLFSEYNTINKLCTWLENQQ